MFHIVIILRYMIMVVLVLGIASCSNDSNEDESSANSNCAATYPAAADSPYVLPYNIGDAYRVSQGNCSTHTHTSQYSLEFAYDFLMDIGTPIHAARAGTVSSVREDVGDGTTGFDNINYVAIDHGDGTRAYYLHISQNGAQVNQGEIIMQGQQIALSGNTGTLGTPHLHFHVQQSASNANGYQSIPISFFNASPSDSDELIVGTVYTALSY